MLVAVPEGVTLQWNAPAQCPDAATARATVQARVAEGIEGRTLRADATVTLGDDGQWWVTVELAGDGIAGTRTLRAPTCEEALTATAVVVAIALDPKDETAEPTPVDEPAASPSEPAIPAVPVPTPATVENSSTVTPTSTASDRVVAPASADETDRAREPARWLDALLVEARGGLDVGALPGPSGSIAGAVGLRGERWWITGGATHRFRTEQRVDDEGRGGRFRQTAAQLMAGPWLSWGQLELPLRGGIEGGVVWARGQGPVAATSVRRLWVAAIASVAVGWAPADAFALRLGVDGVLPLARPRFTLGDAVNVHTVGPVALRAWLGVEVRLSFENRGRAGK